MQYAQGALRLMKRKDKTITFRLDAELVGDLKAAAAANDLPIAQLIRAAIREKLERQRQPAN